MAGQDMRYALVVPTLNGGSVWRRWLGALKAQAWRPERVVVVDSSSDDHTVSLAREAGCEVHVIRRDEFDHGGTRNLAAALAQDADVLIYMTQDALLGDKNSLQRLVAPFAQHDIAAAYGRQLPRANAGPIEAYARLHSYPGRSEVRGRDAVRVKGLRTVFFSNSFAAYRVTALEEVGNFPKKNIVAEDMYVVAKALLSGWRIAYVADAVVTHSHKYTLRQEFSRYFDTGVFHAREPWIRREFGVPEREGRRYVLNELRSLAKTHPLLLPAALGRDVVRYLGFELGLREARIPRVLKFHLSMHKGFWK